jgi:hypothetical protein
VCREKRRARDRASYARNRDKRISEASDRALQTRYGISREEYDEILCIQNGVCGICGTKPGARRLAVDHDHETGEIRGLLCANCNRALGNLKDDHLIAYSAYQYLKIRAEEKQIENAFLKTLRDYALMLY